jgi:hypothetical protein
MAGDDSTASTGSGRVTGAWHRPIASPVPIGKDAPPPTTLTMLLELLLLASSAIELLDPDDGAWGRSVFTGVSALLLLVGWALVLHHRTGNAWPVLVPFWGDAQVLKCVGYTKWWCKPAWLLPPAAAVMRFIVPIALVSRHGLSTLSLVLVAAFPPIGLVVLALEMRRVARPVHDSWKRRAPDAAGTRSYP